MCYVRSEDRISKEELITRLKLNSMRECLFDRTLQWFGDLEKREESAWSSEYMEPSRIVVVSLQDDQGQHGMRYSEVI